MADKTKIEWTDATWNPITGCSVTSPGCTNCYAMQLAGTRLKHHESRFGLTRESGGRPKWTGEVRFNEQWLDQPIRWKRPRKIFVCAHGDLFHENVPDEWIDRVFAVMARCPQHIFQVLTKRADRMRKYISPPPSTTGMSVQNRLWKLYHANRCQHVPAWPLPNVWLGVSVEDQERADERIPALLHTPAAVRWASCEPLLGSVDLTNISGAERSRDYGSPVHGWSAIWRRNALGRSSLDWVVVGGESGPGARPMHPDWARSIRDQCADAGVPFHFKQWGNWSPVCAMSDDAIDGCYHPAPASRPDATRVCKVNQCVLHGDGQRFDGSAMHSCGAFAQGSRAMLMMEIGKKAAGRLLDGVEHNGEPV